MSYIDNKWLEKYEVKGTDYDPIVRDYIGMEDVKYDSIRYEKDGLNWREKNQTEIGDKTHALVMFAGDITCFERQMEEARVGEDYDFRYAFKKVAPIFAQADLVVGNLETMLSPSAPYRFEQYVCEQDFACNGPVEFLDALREAGFDVLTNANNHDLDVGAVGVGETIDNIERFGFIHTGTFKSDKRRYEIIDVKGMKIALVAFEIDQNGKGCNLTDEGKEFLLHDYSAEKAAAIIEDARKEGADFVISCPHWGKENSSVPNKDQLTMAREMADMGYDCIIGSHTHVIQPFDILEANGKQVPVFYCMGNFISHNVDNKKSRTLIACIDIEKDGDKKSLKCSYIPMYTSEHCGDKKYVVVPTSAAPKSQRNKRRLKRIKDELGDKISINEAVKVKEFMEKRLPVPKKEKAKVDFNAIKEFPYIYDSGKFVFEIFEDHAIITAITAGRPQVSYTTDVDVLGLPVTALKEGAFSDHEVMRKIKFMDNIVKVEDRVCNGCKELEGLRLGNRTKVVGYDAFSNCPKLKCVVLKNSVDRVEEMAFSNNPSLRSVKVPRGVNFIADSAFSNCPDAIFYAEEGSYGYKWAEEHGFKVKHMKLYEGKGSTLTEL